MPEADQERVTAADLFALPLFEGESPEAVEWIAERMTVERFDTGDRITSAGEAVTDFSVVLEGEVHFRREGIAYTDVLVRSKGQTYGMLPFSRLKISPARGWAVQPTRAGVMDGSHLRELVYRAPSVAQRLVSEMMDRSREMLRIEEGGSRLLALGKLSAGLAHELNNPASAAVRSAARLREALAERRKYALIMFGQVLPDRAREIMAEATGKMDGCASSPGSIDPIERADRESDLGDWLERAGVPVELASSLIDADVAIGQLEELSSLLTPEQLTISLRVLVTDHEILCLTLEIEEASRRVSDLVKAVKEYSYMDSMSLGDVDIDKGVDATLRMFQHRLKYGVKVLRQSSGGLPQIRANGSALNQIWTNLIDNALDSMDSLEPDQPRVLMVTTRTEPGVVLVEIADTGPGIPEAIKRNIFEPFYTTKSVGKGTGLGLDIVQRIIRNHKGSIRVDSVPGRTAFQVRLPQSDGVVVQAE